MAFENEYVKTKKKKSPLAPFLPVLGLILAVALVAIAYTLSPTVLELLEENIDNFPKDTEEIKYVVTGALFLVLLLFAGMIYALFSPKPPKLATDAQLRQERTDLERERRMKKRRRRETYKKMSEERRQRGQ
jgi:uncharacterized BrkB/YihY/UPF0761 family membrane protein